VDDQRYIENAIHWARQQLRSKAYAFLCLSFLEDAYEEGNGIEIFGGESATESAELYGVQTVLPIPEGAFVFYACSGPFDGVERNRGM
jgi:hypothetical protein